MLLILADVIFSPLDYLWDALPSILLVLLILVLILTIAAVLVLRKKNTKH